MDLPLFNGRPVTVAADVAAITDYIPLRRSAEVGDNRHTVISPAEFAVAISPYVVVSISASSIGLGNVQNIALSAWEGSTTLSTVGTVTAGSWNAGIIPGQYGGTGTNNSGQTLEFMGAWRLMGNSSNVTLSATGNTTLILPIAGTLATTSQIVTYTNGTGLNLTGTVFSVNSSIATTTTTQTLTNKTLTSPIVNVGSDATGDMYYRDSSGLLTRIPIGTSTQVLTISSGLPQWMSTASSDPTTLIGITKSTLGSSAYVSITADTTLTNDHNGKVLKNTTGSDYTLTIPAGLVVPFTCGLKAIGVGKFTIAVSGGNVLKNVDAHTSVIGSGGFGAIDWENGTDVWLYGKTSA